MYDHSMRGSGRRGSLLAWALAFWAATYLLFTLRAHLASSDAVASLTLSGSRLVSISAGTALFAAVIYGARYWRTVGRAGMRLLWSVVPASLIVLGVRAIVNDVAGEPIPFGNDVRWMLTWASYFGFALGLFLLAHRESATRRMRDVAVPLLRPVDWPEPEACEWAIDMLADELAAAPEATRATLIARLRQRAGYEVADGLDADAHNGRIHLVERLATRL